MANWFNPSSYTLTSIRGVSWDDLTYTYDNDTVYATALNVDKDDLADIFLLTGFGAADNQPADVSIASLDVRIKAYVTGGNASASISVQFNQGGNGKGNIAIYTLPASDSGYHTYTRPTNDIWGSGLTLADLQDPTFGVELIANNPIQTPAASFYIDHVQFKPTFIDRGFTSVLWILGLQMPVFVGNGTSQSQPATSSGLGKRVVVGNGASTSQASISTGSGVRVVVGSGNSVSGPSTSYGQSVDVVTGNGASVSQPATSSGYGKRVIVGSGTGVAQSSSSAGLGAGVNAGTGDCVAQPSSCSGTGKRVIVGAGASAAASSASSGIGTRTIVGNGESAANDSESAGSGVRVVVGNGACVSGPSTSVGYEQYILAPAYFVVDYECRGFIPVNEPRLYEVTARPEIKVHEHLRIYYVDYEDRTYVVRTRYTG